MNLFLSVGLPPIVLGISVGVNVSLYLHLSTRLDARLRDVGIRIDTLTSKVVEIGNRLVRLESKFGMLP